MNAAGNLGITLVDVRQKLALREMITCWAEMMSASFSLIIECNVVWV